MENTVFWIWHGSYMTWHRNSQQLWLLSQKNTVQDQSSYNYSMAGGGIPEATPWQLIVSGRESITFLWEPDT